MFSEFKKLEGLSGIQRKEEFSDSEKIEMPPEFKKLEGCSMDEANNAGLFLFVPPQMMSSENCRISCSFSQICQFFIMDLNVCYLGSFSDANPLPKPPYLVGKVDVYLKNVYKATNAALQSCNN